MSDSERSAQPASGEETANSDAELFLRNKFTEISEARLSGGTLTAKAGGAHHFDPLGDSGVLSASHFLCEQVSAPRLWGPEGPHLTGRFLPRGGRVCGSPGWPCPNSAHPPSSVPCECHRFPSLSWRRDSGGPLPESQDSLWHVL